MSQIYIGDEEMDQVLSKAIKLREIGKQKDI